MKNLIIHQRIVGKRTHALSVRTNHPSNQCYHKDKSKECVQPKDKGKAMVNLVKEAKEDGEINYVYDQGIY